MPPAVLFLPIVKRLAIDLVNRRLGHLHFAGRPGQEEIDVVGLAVGSLHVHAREVFPGAEIL